MIVGSPSVDERGMVPKNGLGTLSSERGAEFQLLLRQLIDVAVRDPDVRDLRSEVRDFDGRVRRQLALHRHVPLLRVARPQLRVNGEHALSEAGIWRRTDWCDGRPVLQHERRCDVVERSLRDVLEKWKVWRREGRGNPRHLDPDLPVARTDNGPVRQAIDGAKAWTEVVLLERPYRIRARIFELLVSAD